jgi:hypothetical protein
MELYVAHVDVFDWISRKIVKSDRLLGRYGGGYAVCWR